MNLVFVNGRTMFSWFIRWLSHDDFFKVARTSHFVFVFKEGSQGVLFEFNLLGSRLKFWGTTIKHVEVLDDISIPLTSPQIDEMWRNLVQFFDGKRYDYLGAVYLGYRRFLRKAFKRPMPAKNKWAKSDAFFCNELVTALNLMKGFRKIPFDASMLTPEEMRGKLLGWVAKGIN